MSQDKMVHDPAHYQSKTGLTTWDVIEAFTDGLNGREAFDAGCLIKYACRWHKKDGIRDLEKIIEYATHLIEGRRNSNSSTTETVIPDDNCSNIIVNTRDGAEEVLSSAEELIEICNRATISKLCEFVDKPCEEHDYQK